MGGRLGEVRFGSVRFGGWGEWGGWGGVGWGGVGWVRVGQRVGLRVLFSSQHSSIPDDIHVP